tara:strand:+ start:45 stop:215 length:171 start_codon:yes stop_codon:yes gene_type:complete
MAKKKSKAKKENTDSERIKELEERLNEIRLRWHAMTAEEQRIVEEARTEINQIKNK